MDKQQKRHEKKRIVILCCVLALAIMGITGVAAYLIDTAQADNTFTVGGNRIELTEDFDPPSVIEPGTRIKKDVKVTNVGPSSCYVRVMAVFSNSDMGQYCDVNWNTEDWVYNAADGYYYYLSPISTGKATSSLFTTITVKEDTPEAVIDAFNMIVYAESCQSEGYSDYQSAWAAYRINKPN